jgi:hypothetical protein
MRISAGVAQEQRVSAWWRILTLITCAVFSFEAIQRGGGGLICIASAVLMPYFVFRFWISARRRSNRAGLRKTLLAWMIALAVPAVWHAYMLHCAQTKADSLVEQVAAFYRDKGRYPAELTDMGLDEAEMARIGLRYWYFPEADEPQLFYRSTFVASYRHTYHFKNSMWVWGQLFEAL